MMARTSLQKQQSYADFLVSKLQCFRATNTNGLGCLVFIAYHTKETSRLTVGFEIGDGTSWLYELQYAIDESVSRTEAARACRNELEQVFDDPVSNGAIETTEKTDV